jgi:inhibitor of KinA
VQQLWQIPVCYHPSFGLDLEEMAAKKHCTVEEIIALHTGVSYLIYFIGFLPGFLYLGGLHATLHTPRIATPRIRVAKGSVGIGGAQTGVYPQNSSGGWNIIGKSPVNFFNTNNVAPIFAKPGDRIQFIPITLATFYEVEKEVANKTYTLKSSLL